MLIDLGTPFDGYFSCYEVSAPDPSGSCTNQIGSYWYNLNDGGRGASGKEVANSMWGLVDPADSNKVKSAYMQGIWMPEGSTNGPQHGYQEKGGIIGVFSTPDEGQWLLSRSTP
jgi:hypothetical protein